MASVTSSAQSSHLAFLPASAATIRIEPPRSLFELRLRGVWAYRELLYFFAWRDVKIRHNQTAIGVIWVNLQPILNMLVFALVFGRFAKLPSDDLPCPIFYFAVIPCTYFSYSLSSTTNVVVERQHLITKAYFPRLSLPTSLVLSAVVDFAIGFVVLSIVCLAYSIRPTLVAVLVLLALFTSLGVGLWLSALNALYRDVRYLISFMIHASSALWRWLYGLNPVAGVIDGFRWAITGRGQAPGLLLLASAFAAALAFLGAFFSIAWRPPLPIACNASRSLPLVSKRKDYSSFIDKCVDSPNYRLAVDELMKSRFLFCLPERVGEIAH